MTQYFEVHPQNPQPRLIQQAADLLREGGLLVYPTDSTYALGCALHATAAQERLRQIRQLDLRHDLSLLFPDISRVTEYAKVDNAAFRLLKQATPGPFTFILPASRDLPRKLADPRKKTIGIRIPAHPVSHALLASFGEPLLNSTLTLPGDDRVMTDPADIRDRLKRQVDLILDGGAGGLAPSTVLDLTVWPPQVMRHGCGDPQSIGIEMQN